MNAMRRLLPAALAGLAISGAAWADEAALMPDEIKQAVRVESITIPTPGEFFVAIDKAGRPQWSQLVRTGVPTTSSRAQIALILGTLVADGYIAVEAEDGQSVKNIGKDIINLAKKLNVSQSVLGRGNSINDFATNSNWSALREELEATQNEVKLDMVDQKDSDLVTLVTLGAWLRGTEIASEIVDKDYSADSARLLRQPAIIDYLLDEVGTLGPALQKDPLVVSIRDALARVRADVTTQVPSAQNIKDMHQIISSVVTAIRKNSSDS